MSLISVIVPVYNVEAYLRRCLNSLQKQYYKNLEIIVVDDGSTDQSYRIAKEYEFQDARFKVVQKANGGLSSARNFGLQYVSGDYISFIDSDDFISEDYYSLMMNYINKDTIVMCYFQRFTKEKELNRFDEYKVKSYTSQEALNLLYSDDYVQTVIACNKLVPKDLVQKNLFPLGVIYEDEATTYKWLDQCKTVTIVTKPMYYYFIREGSITKIKYHKRRFDYLQALKDRVSYFSNHNVEMYAKTVKAWFYATFEFMMELKVNHIKDDEKKQILYHQRKESYHLLRKIKYFSLKTRCMYHLAYYVPFLYYAKLKGVQHD